MMWLLRVRKLNQKQLNFRIKKELIMQKAIFYILVTMFMGLSGCGTIGGAISGLGSDLDMVGGAIAGY